MDTRMHTPVRPSRAERARTVLAAAASVSVHWRSDAGEQGRVDLLGCHRDDRFGDVVLTLEPGSNLVRAAREAARRDADLPVEIELTDLCPVSARERIRGRLTLHARLSAEPEEGLEQAPVVLRARVTGVLLSEISSLQTGGEPTSIGLDDYRRAEPDLLHLGAAEQLQHLMAHHPEAIGLLARLCDPAVLQGAVRVLPVALDRFGLVLRVESHRGQVDVRLAFRHPVETTGEATEEVRSLILQAHRRRPCIRPLHP